MDLYDFYNLYKNNIYNFDINLEDYISEKIFIPEEPECNKGITIKAKNNIKKGALLIAEKPIISVNKVDNTGKELPNSDIKKIELFTKLKEKLKNEPEKMKSFFKLYNGKNLNKNLEERAKNNEINDEIILNVLNYNGLSPYKSLYVYTPLVIGLWFYSSLINHSCLPNCDYIGIGDFIFIVSIEDIPKGDELTISYVPNDIEYSERIEKLKKWGFKCQCKLCKKEEELFKNVPEKKIINEYITELNKINHSLRQPYEDYELQNIDNYLEKNKNKVTWYELSLCYYLLYRCTPFQYTETLIMENMKRLDKAKKYIEGKNDRFEMKIYYEYYFAYKFMKKFDMAEKIKNKIKDIYLKIFKGQDKYVDKIVDDTLDYQYSIDIQGMNGACSIF